MEKNNNIGPTSTIYRCLSIGFKDKNGKEIYDGDIWKRESFIGVVVFEFSRWTFKMTMSSGCYQYPSFYSNAASGEIIGNKHENPELLK